MQQVIYSNISVPQSSAAPKTTPATTPNTRLAGLLRWVARKWDLVGVLALMGSSAAYGVYALAHPGL